MFYPQENDIIGGAKEFPVKPEWFEKGRREEYELRWVVTSA